MVLDPLTPEQVRVVRKRWRKPWMAVENTMGRYVHFYTFCPYGRPDRSEYDQHTPTDPKGNHLPMVPG